MAKLIASTARPGSPLRRAREGDDYGLPAEPDWREVDWSRHLHELDVDGGAVNFVDHGEGSEDLAPVVFVHGLGGCWQNWLENIRRVAETGRRVVALDLPGFGFSEPPRDDITISGYGACVNAVCDELDLGEVVVVGNSMGGFVAAETAIQYPERVSRLLLNSAAGLTTGELHHAPLLFGARFVGAAAARVAAMSDRVVVRRRLRTPLYYPIVKYPQLIPSDLLFEITQGSGRPAFHPALKAIFEYEYRDRLPEVRCPTLIVWGADDMLVPRRDADDYERLIPGARKTIMEDTGHTAMVERPRTFNRLLVEFLEADDAPVPEESLGGGANVRGPAGRGAGGELAGATSP